MRRERKKVKDVRGIDEKCEEKDWRCEGTRGKVRGKRLEVVREDVKGESFEM